MWVILRTAVRNDGVCMSVFFFSSRRRHTRSLCDWSSDVCSSDLFTTEVPEYWEHAAENDPNRLLDLYHRFVDPRVELVDLFDGGEYVPRNPWNTSTEGRLAHFVQRSNTLEAAIRLVAEATILRAREDGTPVTDRQ